MIHLKIAVTAFNKQANNRNAPEQSQAIAKLHRVFVSGDWNRSASLAGGTS
ncbi:hypothetical protein [Brasilonema sp. UFV-L1]|uniref:hypothetical protein n=1 Tax=Brasilonema sp. UFV-L1 TaxID=2234130 RepID=UPI0030D8E30D